MRTTLIVGCGYLGSRVGSLLAAQGERVFGTVRSLEKAERLQAQGIEPRIADVLDPATLENLPPADRILYCVGFDRKGAAPMRTVYVQGVENFLDQYQGPASQLVYISSTGVYGRNDGGWVVEDEQSEPEPRHESGHVCLAAERAAANLSARLGLKPLILRCSGLYGPNRVPRASSLKRGEPIVGDPSKFLNLIHIDDVVRGVLAAFDRGTAGRLYHLSDSRPATRQEFYELAAHWLKAPEPRFEPPTDDDPARLREESNKRISNQRMRQELGVELAYPDIQQGLPSAIAQSTSI